jgi:hypothetical protein
MISDTVEITPGAAVSTVSNEMAMVPPVSIE